jgi:hypothetical protein
MIEKMLRWGWAQPMNGLWFWAEFDQVELHHWMISEALRMRSASVINSSDLFKADVVQFIS